MSEAATLSGRHDAAWLDRAALDAYLRRRLPGLAGAMRTQAISGGQSNPTFFVTYDNRRLVLRKQPNGEHLPSAHAVDREFRVMSALAGTGVPVPQMVLLEEDRTVLGTSFYVMERLDGRVVHDSAVPGESAAFRTAVYGDKADTLARLHKVDWQAVGLEGFGRPGNYFLRQVSRWTRQWQTARTRDVPEIDAIARWLPCNVPADDTTTIVHGDYRLGNVMLHPREPRLVGVLDWELSTLGHPLADLAHAVSAWLIRPHEYGGLLGLDLAGTGIPTRQEFEARYLAAAGLSEGLRPFHLAFALFRFAIIFEGIAARAAAGTAAAGNAAEVGRLSVIFGRRAAELLSADGASGFRIED